MPWDPYCGSGNKARQNSGDDSDRQALKSGIRLLANASAHFSVERRKAIMKHLSADIKHLAETKRASTCLAKTSGKEPKQQQIMSRP